MKWLIIIFLLVAVEAWARDPKQVYAFRKTHACPSTGKFGMGACPGHVVDHIIPLSAFGPDRPDNMQWQTVEEAKKKDRLEFEAWRSRMEHEQLMCLKPDATDPQFYGTERRIEPFDLPHGTIERGYDKPMKHWEK